MEPCVFTICEGWDIKKGRPPDLAFFLDLLSVQETFPKTFPETKNKNKKIRFWRVSRSAKNADNFENLSFLFCFFCFSVLREESLPPLNRESHLSFAEGLSPLQRESIVSSEKRGALSFKESLSCPLRGEELSPLKRESSVSCERVEIVSLFLEEVSSVL